MDYELCIPERPDTVARVRSVNKSVTMQGARGRIGCNPSELLCIGIDSPTRFPPGARGPFTLVLHGRIDQAFFE